MKRSEFFKKAAGVVGGALVTGVAASTVQAEEVKREPELVLEPCPHCGDEIVGPLLLRGGFTRTDSDGVSEGVMERYVCGKCFEAVRNPWQYEP